MIADTLRFFESRRAKIIAALGALSPASEAAREPMDRILEFCGRGKMIRGCLVFLGAEAAQDSASATAEAADGGGNNADIPLVAAAMELFQAGLLVHDDIMDRDDTRRGAPTIHARYAAEAEARFAAEALSREAGAAPRGLADSMHIGEALGICVGDLCYFEAFAALSRALKESPRCREIHSLCASGLSEVAVAQMADVAWGAGKAEVPENEILAMYRGKTAHYSFSLPLAVGALAGGAGRADLVKAFWDLGERLGILFQIRDDELGLFGSSQATGKGLGSDLREGKKTLFRSRLLAAAPASELPRLRSLFGGDTEAKPPDIDYLRRLSEELGVARSIGEMSRRAEEEALAMLRALPRLAPQTAAVFAGLVDYVTRRDR
jgi:geranylgeranyl diphosphate synthase, type I